MKKYLLSILLVLMLVLVGCSKNEQENPNLGNENFAIEFLKLENKKENIIYSPLSIKYALNMLNEGALGNTKDEIEKVIKNLTLTKYENYESNLSLATAIFIKDTYTSSVKESYINALTTKYNAEVHNDSFTNASNINNFVKSKTLGLIEKLLDDKDVQDEYLKMILINALGINMEWVEQFKTTSTGGYDFTLASGEKIKATTMHKKSSSDTTA